MKKSKRNIKLTDKDLNKYIMSLDINLDNLDTIIDKLEDLKKLLNK